MLHIRLRRIGKKKQPIYRMIVCEKTKDPWGDYLENLGTYNPRMTADGIQLKADRIQDWIKKGAQCSETVWNLLVDQGIVKGEKRKTIAISKKRHASIDKAQEDKKAAEEAKKAEEEAKKQAEAEAAKAAEEAAKAEAEAPAEEAPVEEKTEEKPAEETPAEEVPAAAPAEEEKKEEAPAEEKPAE